MFGLSRFVFMFAVLTLCSANRKLTVSSAAYLDVSIGGHPCQRIMIGLFSRIVPRTVQNFCDLCTGACGFGYKDSKFHRCIKNFMLQGGDYELGDGRGGTSVYRNQNGEYGTFRDENFHLKHYGAGWLSMANSGPNTNGAQFFITLRKCSFLDNKHVVFGVVIKGMSTVRQIENIQTNNQDCPVYDVVIKSCGVLNCKPFEVECTDVPDNV